MNPADDDFHKSFQSLLTSANMYMIKFLLTNNLVSPNNISEDIKKCCQKHYMHADTFVDLTLLLINIGSDISILEVLFERLAIYYSPYTERILPLMRKLQELGIVMPTTVEKICRLPYELFIEYDLTNEYLHDEKLQIECAKISDSNKLKYIHDILESQNIPIVDPLILFKEAFSFCSHSTNYCISKMQYDQILLNKILFITCRFAGMSQSIFDNDTINNYIFSAEVSLLLLLRTEDYGRQTIEKYLDIDAMKYKDIFFRIYFSDNGCCQSKKCICCTYFKCLDKKAKIIYSGICKSGVEILEDDVYEDLMNKSAYLLNILNEDTRLKKID